VAEPYGRNLGFLDRRRYFFFQVAPQLYSRGWVDPVVYWSEFLITDPEVRVRFPVLPDSLRSSGSGTGSNKTGLKTKKKCFNDRGSNIGTGNFLLGRPRVRSNKHRQFFLQGLKQPGREVDHTPTTRSKVKNTWIYRSHPHKSSWRSAYLVKHRDNFTFTLFSSGDATAQFVIRPHPICSHSSVYWSSRSPQMGLQSMTTWCDDLTVLIMRALLLGYNTV
jgi:hypothetical protein